MIYQYLGGIEPSSCPPTARHAAKPKPEETRSIFMQRRRFLDQSFTFLAGLNVLARAPNSYTDGSCQRGRNSVGPCPNPDYQELQKLE
jgi:hypothetical protein